MLTQTWLVTWNMLLQLLLRRQLDGLAFSCHIHQKVHTVTSTGSVIVRDLPNLDCESIAVELWFSLIMSVVGMKELIYSAW